MTHSVNVGNTSVWVLAEMDIMEQMATVMKRVQQSHTTGEHFNDITGKRMRVVLSDSQAE